MKKYTLAQMAVLIDCEGSLQYNKMQGGYYYLRMVVAMGDEAIIEMIHSKYGGSMYERKMDIKYLRQWVWAMSGKVALRLLKRIYPWLIAKKAQADIVIATGHSTTNELVYKKMQTLKRDQNPRQDELDYFMLPKQYELFSPQG